MCLAIPMQVVALEGEGDDLLNLPVALVEADGIRKEIRLEMVDRIPVVGDYVIIHAGFAIRTLSEAEAKENLTLLRQMASVLEQQGRLPGAPPE